MRALGVLLFLIGCATPYQPQGLLGGYSEMRMGKGWLVEFNGNGWTSQADTYAGAMRRASELCGGDFEVVDDKSSSQRYEVGSNGYDCRVNGDNVNCDERRATQVQKHSALIKVRCAAAH